MIQRVWFHWVLVALVVAAASVAVIVILRQPTEVGPEAIQMLQLARKTENLHRPIAPTRPGDWLESHPEPGQTFLEYVNQEPVRLTPTRNVLYVLPLGDFGEDDTQIVKLSAEFLAAYFACDVKVMDTMAIEGNIPANARRVHPSWGVRQILSTHVLDDLLKPRLPSDAAALIAFTTMDLYPAENWNFVFGQASLKNRVGVWSLFRNGDSESEFETCLMRTLKTATHETGHMFSIRHCTMYECNMCGSNSLSESDRRPVQLCPECVAKVWWATGCDAKKRYKELQSFFERLEMMPEAQVYERLAGALAN